MGYPVPGHAILLRQLLHLTCDTDLGHVALLAEESIVLICSSAVVHDFLEAHLEVSGAHCVRVSHCGLLSERELLGRVCDICTRLILKLCRSVRLRQREVGVARLRLHCLVCSGRLSDLGAIERVLLRIEVLILGR